MPKPVVALLHYSAPPTIGGVESTLAVHARLMLAHGYPVKIIAGTGAADPIGSEPASGPSLDILPDVGSRSPRVTTVNGELAAGFVTEHFDALVGDLVRQLSASLDGSQLVVVHNALSLHKNLALTVALKHVLEITGIRLITWCHDFAWTDPRYAPEMHAGFPWDLLRMPWDNVTYVVVSESRRQELQQLWSLSGVSAVPQIAVVPPGLDLPQFFGIQPQTAEWVRTFDLLRAVPLLLLPARVTRRKNIESTIAVTAALRQQGLDARVIITGPPGPHNPANAGYLESLRALRRSLAVEDAVIFLHEFGRVDDAQLRDLYLIADALLFPSEREGFGIPLLEAGAARLPIFCADIPPFHETAQDNAHYLVPGASASEVAGQIAGVLANDPAFRLKQRVIREYDWERIFSERIEPLLNAQPARVDRQP